MEKQLEKVKYFYKDRDIFSLLEKHNPDTLDCDLVVRGLFCDCLQYSFYKGSVFISVIHYCYYHSEDIDIEISYDWFDSNQIGINNGSCTFEELEDVLNKILC